MQRSTPTALPIVLVLLFCGATVTAAPPPKAAPAALPWPLGLGTIDTIQQRYPTKNASAAALRLMTLGAKVGIEFERAQPPSRVHRQISDWLDAQLISTSDRADPPPPEIREFLRLHDRDMKAIRDLLVINPVSWPVNLTWGLRAPMPNLRAQLVLTRLIVARALANGSWDDLRAAAALQRGLWPRPEMYSQMVAMSSTRLILAAARKMPGPPPPWSAELLQFDARRGLIAAMQWEAWLVNQQMHAAGDTNSIRDQLEEMIKKPFDQMVAGEYHEILRRAAIDLEKSRACAFDGAAFDERLSDEMPFWDVATHFPSPRFGSYWQRAARLTAERELTERVFAVESGRTAAASSQCSDGSWLVRRDANGVTRIRFSREVPVRRPSLAIPLEQVVRIP